MTANQSSTDNEINLNEVLSNVQHAYSRKWIMNLGILNKPGVPQEKVVSSCNERNQCIRQFIENEKTKQLNLFISKEVLQTVLALFCEREECNLNESMISILQMLVPLRCSAGELYNLFYAIIIKFVPRDINEGADCYHLMNLILQYHDPHLSSHLETHKVIAFDYAQLPFASLFADLISKDVLYIIWDKIFEKGDPYLLFTMVLVFLINCSDQLLKMKDREEILTAIKSSMSQLTAPDVDDFIELSVHFLRQTPASIKQDFQRVLFCSKKMDEVKTGISKLLALPVDVRDVIRMGLDENFNTSTMESEPNFFIIDTRSHEEFTAGHLDGSYNLDSTLFVDAPNQYKMAVSSLDSYRDATHPDEHILFMGSGQENDIYLNMVIANFLQQGRKHVAFVDGGYKALHRQLEANLERLNGHCAALCKECKPDSLSESDINIMKRSSWKLGVGSIFGAVRANAPNLGEKVKNLPKIISRNSYQGELTHVLSTQRHGKRYRNEKSVFTLSDSDSEAEEPSYLMAPRASEPKVLTDILKQNDVLEYFEGVEVFSENNIRRTVGCYLALTRTHIHIFHETEKEGEVVLSTRHAYNSILRVTSKKKIPEMLTFKFGFCADEEYKETAVHRFVLPRAGDCARAVKMNIISLCPNVLE